MSKKLLMIGARLHLDRVVHSKGWRIGGIEHHA
jgi:hypothetical protein